MPGQALAALGVFLDDPRLVDCQRHRLAHAGIIERFFGCVEPHEVTTEIIEFVKTGAGAERVEQLGGHEALVPNHIRLAVLEQVDRSSRGIDREKIDDVVFRVGGIPVLFVFPQPNPVAHVPKVERVRATDREGLA